MNVIGIDIGGTKIAGAIFSDTGNILHQQLCKLKNHPGEDVGELVINQIRQLLQISNDHKVTISGCGISVPGIYHVENGTVWAPNIPDWENYPLLQKLSGIAELKHLNIKIDSDRVCYILGETWQGKAKGCRHAIFIAVGTGIGAGIMIDGMILRGSHDIAGAIGWLALDRPFRDEYKRYGCYEYHASGDGITRVAIDLIEKEKNYSGTLCAKSFEQLTSHDIFNAYKSGDAIAAKVFEICIEFWGMTVANLVSIFNPEKIIFGGGVFGPAAQFLDRIKAEAKRWAQPISINQVDIDISALGDNAGLIGAARLPLSGH